MCGEKHAKNYIFNSDAPICKKLLELLEKGHYKPVSNPQEGDLAVFFNEINELPKHIAQCTSKGTFLSKPGIIPYAVEHQVDDVCTTWGKKMVFFHKN